MNREKLKPFIGGAVTGAVALTIVAFAAGWVVTDSSNTRQVETAWIDGQAAICASLVQAHRDATGDESDLSGYQARDTRTELAKTYAVVLRGEDAVNPDVIRACSNLIEKSGV